MKEKGKIKKEGVKTFPEFEGEREEIKLKTELEFFESKKREWLEKYRDKYVLIKGEELIDVFTSVEDAYKEGVRRYGNNPFFIKKVVETEDTEQIPSLSLGIVYADL